MNHASANPFSNRSALESVMPAPFEMVKIPAGNVTLIDTWKDSYFGRKNESKSFDVPEFQIARYPVTNAQFRVFVDAGGYTNDSWWTVDGREARNAKGWTEPRLWEHAEYAVFNRPDHPVVAVSWFESVAFCLWLSEVTGKRIMLPTEQMWQWASQGNTGWAYPWGDEWDGARCQNGGTPFVSNHTSPVTKYAGNPSQAGKGDSPFGVSDMAGNAWEWCLTDYNTGEQDVNKHAQYRVQRGGGWVVDRTPVIRVDFRFKDSPSGVVDYAGFRFSLL